MSDLINPEEYAAAWPGRPEALAESEAERAARFRIEPPAEEVAPRVESAWDEPEDAQAPEEPTIESQTARALLAAAVVSDEGRASTRGELLLAAQAWATLDLADAMRGKVTPGGGDAYRVNRETGQFEYVGHVGG